MDYFRSVVAPLLGPDEEFLGELDADGKFALLGNAVALLNPVQWDEPFGMVMIEALAAGTPVVATQRGSASEIVQHGVTGFLASATDELASCLQRASGLDRHGCRSDVETRFSAAAMSRKYVELFEDLL
ncbi:hypothetical protein DQ354_19075 [Arthrobacter sp. AQ5-06]|nr:hypothetical protein DQ354_19075 [Arthrobacter sp. AQ5-06]